MGDINVFTGPMKCGKTQKMLNELERQAIIGKDIKIFKPAIDKRFGNNTIQTRSGKKIDAININSKVIRIMMFILVIQNIFLFVENVIIN